MPSTGNSHADREDIVICAKLFFIAASIMESGIRAGWLFYAAASLAGFIVVPEKLALVPYIVFGFYGIAKYYIEKRTL